MKIIYSVILLSAIAVFAKQPKKLPPAVLKYTISDVFQFVLTAKKQQLNQNIPFPQIYYKSKTPLKQFQDAIEKQWGQRPNEITNAFADSNNEIYLLDDADYYIKSERCMDDSLAHELTHYIQSKYQKFDMNDESLEWDAVDIQTQFREKYCPTTAPQSYLK